MAKKAKKQELKEVSRVEINGNIIITFEDGSIQIIPAPITLSAEQAKELFGSDEDDEEEEEEEEEDDDDNEDEEEDDDSDDDEEDEDDGDEEEDDEEDDEEEVTGESLAEMDFEELEDLCDDKDLDTDPDDYEEKDIEKLRKAIAKELNIKLPASKEKPSKKKGKK